MATLTSTVAWRAALADEWTVDANLFAGDVHFRLSPSMPMATIRRQYGFVHLTGDDGSRGAVAPLDLRGKYVAVAISDGTNSVTWYGYCPAQTDSVFKTHAGPDGGGEIESGETQYTAYGMEYLLDAAQVRFSYGTGGRMRRPLPYNYADRSRTFAVVGNRATAELESFVYEFSDNETDGQETWTAIQALNNLLYSFEQEHGVAFSFGGQYASLTYTGVWQTEGRTYRQVLNDIINPARGFTYFVDGTTIYVVSVSENAIGAIVPANGNVVSLTLDESDSMIDATIRNVENAHYDKIEVRGNRPRVCFTKTFASGGFQKGWSDADETAYNAATDLQRQNDEYAGVYCRFILDNTANITELGHPVNADTGFLNTSLSYNYFRLGMTLDRALPFKRGDDYMRPLVLVKDSDGNYRRIDAPGEDYSGCSVRMLDNDLGFVVDAPYPHFLGKNRFTGDSSKEAVWDYQDIKATVCAAVDDVMRIEKTSATGESGEVTRVKTLHVPEAHLWLVKNGTVLDADGTTQSGDEYVRDDTDMLSDLAEIALAWYGRQRSSIKVRYGSPLVLNRLGHIIAETYTGGSATPAGTIIHSIHYSLENQQSIEFDTEFYDIDLRRTVAAANFAPQGTNAAFQDMSLDFANIAVRQTTAVISRKIAVADVGGKAVTSGVVASSTITKPDGSTVDATIRLQGLSSSQSFTFPSGVEIPVWEYGYDDGGTWTAAWAGWWPYSMTDYDGAKSQAYIHKSGAFGWLDMGCG